MPEVSIVMPAYNAAQFLTDAVASVVGQTFRDWELVIVDDGSTDDTAAVACACAARDPRVRVVRQANAGVANARNFGLSHAHPDSGFVIFLDADDLWLPHTLATLHGALCASPQAVGAHGLAVVIDSNGHPLGWDATGRFFPVDLCAFPFGGQVPRQKLVGEALVLCDPEEPTTFAMFVLRNSVWTPGMVLLRRSSLPPEPFDQSVSPSEDWDLWVRLCLRGDMAFANEVVIHYRKHGAGASGDRARMRRAERAARRKWLEMPELVELGFEGNLGWGQRLTSTAPTSEKFSRVSKDRQAFTGVR